MERMDKESATPPGYQQYQAYLLRLWSERPHGSWQASLQDATTGERHIFGCVDQLAAFLQTITADTGPSADREPEP